jgi:SAM-dependent methyltransferase
VSKYDREFYRELDTTAAPSAQRILPLLLALAPVRSVVDVGCGDGGWLGSFRASGVEDVLGVDGPWVGEDQLKIPADRFRRMDLERPIDVGRRFDLAMSLEVAEHLPATSAPGFARSLADLAPLVLFSAAVPGQGGAHHVNEQWPAYWEALFAARGFVAIDCFRPAIWSDPAISWWYRQNLLLFAHPDALALYPRLREAKERAGRPLPLVHPELFAEMVHRSAPGLGRWLRQGPRALRRTWRKRRG